MLVARSDAIENVEGDVRDAVVGLHQHFHPVFQRLGGHGKLLRFILGRSSRHSRAYYRRAQQSAHKSLVWTHNHPQDTQAIQTHETAKMF
jgi:DNA-binding GntR family transcriptional regulator